MNVPTSPPACPFVPSGKIDDPRCFVGRKEALRFLADRMSGAQPISVNVVGERLCGKSSLLSSFAQRWAEHVPAPARFRVMLLQRITLSSARA